MINEKNWTHCIYQNPHSLEMAQISMGANWENDRAKDVFFVAHLDENHLGVNEDIFEDIAPAITFINSEYDSWEFVDLEFLNSKNKKEKESEGGCDNCSAH